MKTRKNGAASAPQPATHCQLAALLAGKRTEFDHPDNKLAADFAFRQVFATLDQTVRFPGFAPTAVKLTRAGYGIGRIENF